jgi:autotransporter adhesin
MSSVALGQGSAGSADHSTAVGSTAQATANAATAVGRAANAPGRSSLAMGDSAYSPGMGSSAIGPSSQSPGDFSSAVGYGSTSEGEAATAIGPWSQASAPYSTAIGPSASAEADGSVALGARSRATAQDCIALGSNSACDEENTAAFGDRRLTGVTAGTGDSDAANVGQLKGPAAALGGGAGYTNGTFVAPVYTFRSGAAYSDVGSALYDLDGRVTRMEQNPGSGTGTPGPQGPQGPAGQDGEDNVGGGSTVAAGKNVEVRNSPDGTQTVSVRDNVQLSDAGSVSVGATTVNANGISIQGGPSVTNAGVNAGYQRVTNVSAGRIERGSTDAVNGGQVWDMQQTNNDRWTQTERRFERQDRRIDGLGAQLGALTNAAMAAAQNGAAPVGQVNFNAGIGFSGNAAALAVGFGARVSDRVSVSGGVSFGARNKPIAGLGISINLGR